MKYSIRMFCLEISDTVSLEIQVPPSLAFQQESSEIT